VNETVNKYLSFNLVSGSDNYSFNELFYTRNHFLPRSQIRIHNAA